MTRDTNQQEPRSGGPPAGAAQVWCKHQLRNVS